MPPRFRPHCFFLFVFLLEIWHNNPFLFLDLTGWPCHHVPVPEDLPRGGVPDLQYPRDPCGALPPVLAHTGRNGQEYLRQDLTKQTIKPGDCLLVHNASRRKEEKKRKSRKWEEKCLESQKIAKTERTLRSQKALLDTIRTQKCQERGMWCSWLSLFLLVVRQRINQSCTKRPQSRSSCKPQHPALQFLHELLDRFSVHPP